MRKLVFRVYAFKARVYIDTFNSKQTILEFCKNWFDLATAGATSSNKASMERLQQMTLYNILKFDFLKFC